MAGTLPILKIRSSNFLVGLLTAIPMTCYNERKIFKILKFLTHPNSYNECWDGHKDHVLNILG